MSIRDQEHSVSLDLQQLYPFWMKFRFVDVRLVEAEKSSAHRYPSLAVRQPQISDDHVANISGFKTYWLSKPRRVPASSQHLTARDRCRVGRAL